MKKLGLVTLLTSILLLGTTLPSQARDHRHGGHFVRPAGHARVFIGGYFGPPWWGPYWYPGYAYPPPYVYSPPPVIVREEPPVYVQQEPSYWYYCESAKAYYPYVQQCPSGWLKVAPQPAPPQPGQ